MTTKAYRDNYALIDWSKPIATPVREARERARSSLQCPMVVSDAMPLVQSMTDGSWHDSKASIRANYRRHKVVEVGNDPARLRLRQKPKIDRSLLKQAVEKATARFERGERAS